MNEFESAYNRAALEFASLAGEKETIQKRLTGIDSRLSALRQTITALEGLVSAPFVMEVKQKYDVVLAAKSGLKEMCLQTLRIKYPEAVRAFDVRDHLRLSGYDLDRYANPLGAIETTLSRLVPNEATECQVDHKRAYRYRSTTERLSLETPPSSTLMVDAVDRLVGKKK
jgi:hypothetical protein